MRNTAKNILCTLVFVSILVPQLASALTLQEQDQLQSLLSKISPTAQYLPFTPTASTSVAAQILQAVNATTFVPDSIQYAALTYFSSTSSTSIATSTLKIASDEAAIEALQAKIVLLKNILANLVATAAYKRTAPATSMTTAATSTPTSPDYTLCPKLTKTLLVGSLGTEVSSLQRFLMLLNFLPEEADTGTFDINTEAAVQRFQVKNNIVKSGDAATTGYGATGPKTRAALAKCSVPPAIATPTVIRTEATSTVPAL